jgi:tryptophanyl-tRNA synthetase
MTQDMAGYFNQAFKKPVFVRPEAKLSATPKVPGTDGEKMSKSYGNTIDLQMNEKELKKAVMSMKTDSTPVELPKNPETCNVFALYALFATEQEQAALAERYKKGGMGYGEAKKLLLEKIEAYFAPYRAKRADLVNNLDYVREVLRDGAERARAVASQTLKEAKEAAGLI